MVQRQGAGFHIIGLRPVGSGMVLLHVFSVNHPVKI